MFIQRSKLTPTRLFEFYLRNKPKSLEETNFFVAGSEEPDHDHQRLGCPGKQIKPILNFH